MKKNREKVRQFNRVGERVFKHYCIRFVRRVFLAEIG